MIEELRTLAEKATPGPWRVGNGGYSHGAEFEIETAEDDAIYVAGVPWGDKRVEPDIPTHHTAQANAALIVALVNNLPAILTALSAVPVMKGALEDIGIYGCGMLNQPIELNQPPEQWMQKRIEQMEQVARQALAALEAK